RPEDRNEARAWSSDALRYFLISAAAAGPASLAAYLPAKGPPKRASAEELDKLSCWRCRCDQQPERQPVALPAPWALRLGRPERVASGEGKRELPQAAFSRALSATARTWTG